jgi:GH25 family lysozyme M1 (1,4-beta-N-acetylmuramidase)
VEVSCHQRGVDFAAVKASGRDFAVIKATEGVGWTDPTFAAYRQAAHAAGLIVGIYHFARPDTNSPAAEAQSFLSAVGAVQPGEFLVLDWEVPYGGDHVAWCKAWLDAVAAQTGVNPLIYMNQSTAAGHNWTPVAANSGLWLARYDNAPASQTSVAYWGSCAMKQYSDAGTVPGVPGTCDVNAFYGTTAQLLAYGKGGATPMPSPALTVQEDDMRIIQNTARGIALVGPGAFVGLSPDDLAWAGQMYGAPVVFDTPAKFDACVAAHLGSALPTDGYLKRVSQGVWEMAPVTRGGAWPIDRLAGVDDKTSTIADDVKNVQTPQVDPVALAAALTPDHLAAMGKAAGDRLAERAGSGS